VCIAILFGESLHNIHNNKKNVKISFFLFFSFFFLPCSKDYVFLKICQIFFLNIFIWKSVIVFIYLNPTNWFIYLLLLANMTIVSNISWILLLFGCHGCVAIVNAIRYSMEKQEQYPGSISAYNKKMSCSTFSLIITQFLFFPLQLKNWEIIDKQNI
jgi:hypothetical protein